MGQGVEELILRFVYYLSFYSWKLGVPACQVLYTYLCSFYINIPYLARLRLDKMHLVGLLYARMLVKLGIHRVIRASTYLALTYQMFHLWKKVNICGAAHAVRTYIPMPRSSFITCRIESAIDMSILSYTI